MPFKARFEEIRVGAPRAKWSRTCSALASQIEKVEN